MGTPTRPGQPGILAPMWARPQATAEASNQEQSTLGYRLDTGCGVWSRVPQRPSPSQLVQNAGWEGGAGLQRALMWSFVAQADLKLTG